MDQLIVLVVVGLLAFGKWLLENAGKSSDEESGDTRPTPPRPDVPQYPRPNPNISRQAESDEEKMRRFLEALGLPKDSVPPAAPKPVAKPAMKRPEPVAKPTSKPEIRHIGHPISPAPAPAARRSKIAPPLETGGPMPTLPKTAPINETAPSMEVASIPQMSFRQPERFVQEVGAEVAAVGSSVRKPTTQKPGQTTGARDALLEQLRTPASLRNAILLREILGSPKGLQSTQTPSTFCPL